MPFDTTKEFYKLSINGIISGLGGTAMILYHISTGQKYTRALIAINVLLAMYIGPVVAGFVPDTWGDLKFSIVSLSGVGSIYIFKFLSEHFSDFLSGLLIFIKKKLGMRK